MNLDFSKCKTKEDVEKVFKEHQQDFKVLKKIKQIGDKNE
ncbi:unnamed protein product [marine sediment metagenome]|uniref:Uncharacterized protein n=1 Tax=marine sediment metagenome TaxID=412755 RepID=X0YJU5_9ZZZZ